MAKKKMGLFSAVALGVSAIIGSGWLFAAYKTADVAGPAALLSWIIGAFIIGLLAMCFAEIAALYPRRGLSAIIPTMSHNKYFGFPFAIANWLGVVAVIPLEATATVQYLITLAPQWSNYLFYEGALTPVGTLLSVLLVVLFSLVNFWGARSFIKTNNVFAILKVIVPIVVALAIMFVSFHPCNLTSYRGTFTPYGWSSVFSVILSSGIIIAFNGFQTVISFASEIKKPQKTIPQALLISIVFCLFIYLLLQFAFLVGMPTAMVAKGWHHLDLYAPLLQLTALIGLGVLNSVIYFGATVSPSGSAVAFMGTATRMFTAMSRNQQVPSFFDKVDPLIGLSRRSLLFNTALSIAFLLVFKSWSTLALMLSLLHIVSYIPIPIALCIFRKSLKKKHYPFILPFGNQIAFFLFVVFTYLFTLANMKEINVLMLIFLCFQAVFILISTRSWEEFKVGVLSSASLFGYFLGLYYVEYFTQIHPLALLVHYHVSVILLFAALFYFVFTRQESSNIDVITDSVNIYK